MTELPGPQPRLSLMVAVFLTALSVLAFEVALSRAFSVLLRYHFVFLAISLATCGLGVGGLLDYLTAGWFHRTLTPARHLASRAAALAVLYPLAIYLLFATPLAARLTSVWVVSSICLLPFLMAGMLLSRVFAEHSAAGGTLYFADLLGAALGSFLVIAGLQLLGATNVPVACGLMAAAVSLALLWPERRPGPLLASAGLGLLLVLALAANLTGRYVDLPVLPLKADPNAKPLYQELGDDRIGAKILYSEWNAFARTDVVANKGRDGQYHDTDDLFIYTDGEVPTNMLWFHDDLKPLAHRLRGFIGYTVFDWFRPEDVLLIGPGGGLDILLAAAVGARRVDGVELNPSIPRIMARYRDFNGGVYDLRNVRIYVDEGRSFVRRSKDRYDLIYMALTKTATTAASSLALVEGYIYTTEAIRDYLDHLTPEGKVALVFQEPALLLRTMLAALEALEESGLKREAALDCVAVCSVPDQEYGAGPYRHLLIISKSPLGLAESQRLAARTIAMDLTPGYFPGAYEPIPFSWLTQDGATTPEFIAAWNQWKFGGPTLNLEPRSDDQPFVVDLTYRVPGQYKALLIGAALAALVFSVVAIRLQGRGSAVAARDFAGAVGYFSLLGVGFMVVEVSLAQRLILYLGYPVLTLSVILFALLLGSGSGSLFSQRFPLGAAPRVAAVAAGAVVAYGVVLQFAHQPLVTATLGWDLRWRCLVAFVMLVPLGFALGMPFPTGLRAIGARAQRFVPWMWGVNGLTSVIGSVGAMIAAKLWGFSVTLMLGWAVYLLAGLLAASGLALGRASRVDDA
mgnify:CR=1 FL=1